MKPNPPLERLRYHVTGAIERGEKQAIVGKPMPKRFIFVRVQYIQQNEIPVEVSDDLDQVQAQAAAERILAARPPGERLGTNPITTWHYEARKS